MNLVDQHFKDALRELPERRMSWLKSRRTRRMLVQRARELDGKTPIWLFLQRLVAVPMALMVLMTATAGYGYASPSVVKGDVLYPVKSAFEGYLYPTQGTSEERVAFHLWLSERRYDEVDEILQRLGKAPVAFVPMAYAQESGLNPLDAILLETLQSATQHVDYALLISDEIRDIERVKVVQQEIKKTVEKQQNFVKKSASVLKEVKLQQKKRSRVKPTPPAPQMKEMAERVVASPVPSEALQPASETATAFSLQAETMVEPSQDSFQLQEADLEDASSLIENIVGFQAGLLEEMETKVAEASSTGEVAVDLDLNAAFAQLPDEQEVNDDLFRTALTVHYEEKKKVLSNEIEEIGQVLIAQQESVSPAPSDVVAPPEMVAEESAEISESSPPETASNPPEEAVVTDESSVALSNENPVEGEEPTVAPTLEPLAVSEVLPPVVDDAVSETAVSNTSVSSETVVDPTTESEAVQTEPVVAEPEAAALSVEAPVSIPSEGAESVVVTAEKKDECQVTAELKCQQRDNVARCIEKTKTECEQQREKEQKRKEWEEKERQLRQKAEEKKIELKDVEFRIEKLRDDVHGSSQRIRDNVGSRIFDDQKRDGGDRPASVGVPEVRRDRN